MKAPPGIPVYAFIKRELKNQIESGELAEGARRAANHGVAERRRDVPGKRRDPLAPHRRPVRARPEAIPEGCLERKRAYVTMPYSRLIPI